MHYKLSLAWTSIWWEIWRSRGKDLWKLRSWRQFPFSNTHSYNHFVEYYASLAIYDDNRFFSFDDWLSKNHLFATRSRGGLSIHGPQIQKVVAYSLSTLGSMLMVTCNVLKFDEKMTPYWLVFNKLQWRYFGSGLLFTAILYILQLKSSQVNETTTITTVRTGIWMTIIVKPLWHR